MRYSDQVRYSDQIYQVRYSDQVFFFFFFFLQYTGRDGQHSEVFFEHPCTNIF